MKNKGFTIIESLVAITILVLAVTGASSAVQGGIASYIYSKDQVIAFYLAQEGIEQIRNTRDQNGLAGRDWLTNIADSGDACQNGKDCKVDIVANAINTCPQGGSGCPFLKQDPVSGLYGYVTGPDTLFKRTINVNTISADEVSVLVTVTWTKGSISRQFRARENLLNWQ